MKINQSTELNIDIKTIVAIIMFTSSMVGMYYTLQSDIDDAKKMPKAVIDRIEYDLKQDWHTNHINKLEDEVKELKEWCKELDEEIYKKKR
tara:strand:- start:1332 stop:1604 length:273 start_codon:yes stop_codon:yes gene_type:complete